jgi:hypothetical protein
VSDRGGYQMTFLFIDELRAASRALHALHAKIAAGEELEDESVDALNACLAALWHVSDDLPVMVMDTRNMYLASEGDQRGHVPQITMPEEGPKDPT